MTTGLVLGKFLPPHAGHLRLCAFAAELVDELIIVVGTLPTEPIDGALRHRWMSELHPRATVLHLAEVLPQQPEEHPRFWELWRTALKGLVRRPIDVVVASESYGARLAAELDARFAPCDLSRSGLPISGTAVRADPAASWHLLPAPVQRYYLRRIALVGCESVGKSTLALRLADHFGTVWVPEYARTYLEAMGRDPLPGDFPHILAGQAASEASLLPEARRWLFTDTDPLCTTVWADHFGVPLAPAQRAAALAHDYDLTFLLHPDVPWVADPVRYAQHGAAAMHAVFEARLKQAGRRVVHLRGDWDVRWKTALGAIATLDAQG